MTARATFRRLHATGCFVMPNPWDRGSARMLAGLGFPALASSSAGLAFSFGLPDHADALPVEAVLTHLADLVAATPLPVNADFQAGYGADDEAVAANVVRCVGTGVAGLSIEDATGDPDRPLYDLPEAVDRIRAARAAIDASGEDVVLTGRCEAFLIRHPDPLGESLRRLEAYAEAGAEVLFAPGIRGEEPIRALVKMAGPRPVNVLVGSPGTTVGELADLGVRRISVGSALSRVGWTAARKAAEELLRTGGFDAFAGIASTGAVGSWFGTPT